MITVEFDFWSLQQLPGHDFWQLFSSLRGSSYLDPKSVEDIGSEPPTSGQKAFTLYTPAFQLGFLCSPWQGLDSQVHIIARFLVPYVGPHTEDQHPPMYLDYEPCGLCSMVIGVA